MLAWGDQLCCLKWSCVWKERFQCRLTFIGNLLQETFDFLFFSTIKIRSSIWGFSIFVSSLQQKTQQTPYSTSFLTFEQLWTILCQKTRHSQLWSENDVLFSEWQSHTVVLRKRKSECSYQDLPITSLDALPLSYRRLMGAKTIKLGSWILLGFECMLHCNWKYPRWQISKQFCNFADVWKKNETLFWVFDIASQKH